MSKERELLIGAVEWMHELKYTWVEERDWGDRDLLDLVADINKIEQLLNNPEQEPLAINENTSDTFKELYEFRKAYNVALVKFMSTGKTNE